MQPGEPLSVIDAPTPLRRRIWFQAVIVVLVAFVACGWTGSLEFQLDDFEQIAEASKPGTPAVLLGQDEQSQIDIRGHGTVVKFFRPVLHASFMMDTAIFGARPGPIHLMSVAWHALTSLLLLITARRLGGIAFHGAAFVTALIFAFHPGKWGAVSWIAARGDVLMTAAILASLLFLERWRNTGRSRHLVWSVFMCLLAIGSKEGGIIGPVLLVFVDFVCFRHRAKAASGGGRFVFPIAVLSLVPAYLLLRTWLFGDKANVYAGHARAMTVELIGRMFSDLAPTFRSLVGGYFHYDDDSTLSAACGYLAAALIVGAVLWTLRAPIARGRVIVFFVAAYLITIFPVLRFYREGSGLEASRLFYLPATIVSAAMAPVIEGVKSRFILRRLIGYVFLTGMLTLSGISAFHHIDAQRGASAVVSRIRQDLYAAWRATGKRQIAYLVLDAPTDIVHSPTYGSFMTFAFMKPFVDEELPVRCVNDLGVYLSNNELKRAALLVQALRWVDDESDVGRLEPQSGFLPIARDYRPRITVPPGANVIRLDEGIAPRDVSVIKVEFSSVVESPFDLDLVFVDETKRRFVVPIRYDPSHGALREILIDIADQRGSPFVSEVAWPFMEMIDRIELEFLRGTRPEVIAIDTDAKLAAMKTIAPINGVEVSAAGEEPVFVIEDPEGYSLLRFRLVSPSVSWTMPRSRLLALEGGRLGFRLSMQGIGRTDTPQFWKELSKNGISLIGRQGIERLPLQWLVEGLRGQVDYAQGRSEVAEAMIVR